MKYILFFLSASLLFACESIENPEPINTIDATKTATITGTVTADLNTTTVGKEKVAAGINLLFTVDSRDYAAAPTGATYQKLTYTATTAADGTYSVSIPALTKAITVTINADDFSADQVTSPTTSVKTVYTFSQTTTSIILGKKTIKDLSY